MSIEGHNDLFPAIEAALKEATQPMTCYDVFDRPEVRQVAPSVNRVSDYLSVLFRKGKVTRTQAPSAAGVRTRWAYAWKNKDLPQWSGPELKDYAPKILVDRPNLMVADDGDFVRINLPNFTITIKRNK